MVHVCVKFLHLNNTIFALIVPLSDECLLCDDHAHLLPDHHPGRHCGISAYRRLRGFPDFSDHRFALALPGLATIGLFNPLAFWNDYYLPLMLVTDQNLYNLQYMLSAAGEPGAFWSRFPAPVSAWRP